MWHDNESKIDLIDVTYLKTAISDIILDKSLLPATIGVFGDWGSGKTTILKHIEDEINCSEKNICISFNGWLFEGYEDAKAALMGSILSQLEDHKRIGVEIKEKANDIFEKLMKQINVFSLIGKGLKYGAAFATLGPAGLGIASIADLSSKLIESASEKIDQQKIEEIIKETFSSISNPSNLRKGIHDFHNDFAELLRKTDVGTLIIIIDDLDRCNPDTVIETLEAIRLFLYVKNTVFIIGADERLIRYAVRRRFPQIPGENADVGRDYLEKLIQFPIRIPQMSAVQMETYMNLLFTSKVLDELKLGRLIDILRTNHPKGQDEIHLNYGVAKEVIEEHFFRELEESIILSQQIASVLNSGLNGNPRQCKRFLNSLLLRISMARSKGIQLDKRILAKLMLLEYFRIEWFKKLAEIKDPLNGYSKELNALENFASAKTPGTQSKDDEFGELSDWINDNWMIQWLKSDPSLKGCDLRHYFFFARERLSAISAATSRMTPLAQEILSQLLSVGDAEYKIGISSANKISEADRMAILEELFAKATCEDNEVKRTRFLETIVLWSNNYESLSSQTIAFLKKFPVNFIPIKLVLLLLDPNSAYVQKGLSKELVRNWSDCDNTKLAKIAKKRLEEKSN